MNDKLRSQSLTHPDLRIVRSPTRNIARAVTNEYRSNEDGDVVDDVVVVEMKSFVCRQLASQPQGYVGKVSATSYLQPSSSREYL